MRLTRRDAVLLGVTSRYHPRLSGSASDTDPRIEAILLAGYRAMSPAEKIRRVQLLRRHLEVAVHEHGCMRSSTGLRLHTLDGFTRALLLALGTAPLAACDSEAQGSGGSGAGGGSSSADAATSTATGAATTSTGDANGWGGSGGASESGTGSGGQGGGCESSPDPVQCDAAKFPEDCEDLGCTWFAALDTVTLNPDGSCDNLDTSRCLAVDRCRSERVLSQGYYRDDEVIETSGDCALLGWTACSGEAGEPEACSCTADAGLTCE